MGKVACPTCGEADFRNTTGMRIHHKKVHGESIATESVNCENCGGEVHVYIDQLERAKKHFCSNTCQAEYRTEQGLVEVACDYCGSDIRRKKSEFRRNNNLFCDRSCRGAFQKNRVKLNCDWCGSIIERTPFAADKNDHHFCDRECKADWNAEEFSGEGSPLYEKPAKSSCAHCGEIFTHPRWQDRTFCGVDCLRNDMALVDDYEDAIIEIECDWCGTNFEGYKNYVEDYDHNFCSQNCRDEWYRDTGYYAGENNPAFAGGYEPYYGPNWEQQKRAVLARDNYECQAPDCDVTQSEHIQMRNRKLNVHHIISFREFDSYKKANRLNNLISLCHTCHGKYENEPAILTNIIQD